MSISSAATTPTPSDNAPAETVVSLSGDVLRPFSISADIFPAPRHVKGLASIVTRVLDV